MRRGVALSHSHRFSPPRHPARRRRYLYSARMSAIAFAVRVESSFKPEPIPKLVETGSGADKPERPLPLPAPSPVRGFGTPVVNESKYWVLEMLRS